MPPRCCPLARCGRGSLLTKQPSWSFTPPKHYFGGIPRILQGAANGGGPQMKMTGLEAGLHELRKYGGWIIDDIAGPRPFLGREPARGRLFAVQARTGYRTLGGRARRCT